MEDVDAFSSLYEREGEAVLMFLARRTMDVEVAVDLTAETFAVALGSWVKLRELGAEQKRACLFTVARRQYSHFARSARVERRAVQRLGIRIPTVYEEDLALIEERSGLRELRVLVVAELGRLSDEQQQALRLRIVEELPYGEVARALGVSEQTARARVSRGLRKLTAALEPRLEAWDVAP
jgi:RNA polymerase sigma-70 factor (ECF subfamily)